MREGNTTTAKVIPLPVRMECSSCGATANASCGCGAHYIPAGARARAAVAQNPHKSDRALAKELGVDDKTVGRARRSTAAHAAVTKRVGADGKARKMPRKPDANARATKVDQYYAGFWDERPDVTPEVRARVDAIMARGRTARSANHALQSCINSFFADYPEFKTEILCSNGTCGTAPAVRHPIILAADENIAVLVRSVMATFNKGQHVELPSTAMALEDVNRQQVHRGRVTYEKGD